MPHIIVKLWPGKTENEKQELADAISKNVCEILNCGDESVSVGFEEVSSKDWAEKVYHPDIINRPKQIYKKPGYKM